MTDTATVFVDLIEMKPLTFDEYITRYPSRALNNRIQYERYLERFQPWRWVALNADNEKKMARSTERYFNRADALNAITQLFGPSTNVHLRQHEQGNQVLRMAVEQ